jgi:hypothetical protein
MFKYWKKIDSLNHMNRLLLAFSAVLTVIILSLVLALATTQTRYEFWLSPTMSANGGLMRDGKIPDEYVQGFVASMLPTLYTWSKSGKEEFAQNIAGFHYYFTPRHQKLLEKTRDAYDEAQLFNRTQIASLYRFIEPGDIKTIAPDTWEVRLIMRITQRLNDNNAMVIADKVVEYHVKVVKVRLSKLHNPFQLALDGYTQPEKRLSDLLENDKEHADEEN